MRAANSGLVVLFLVSILTTSVAAQHAEVRVGLDTRSTLEELLEAGFDVLHVEPDGPGGSPAAHVAARPADLARLAALGISYDVVHANLEAFYAERAARGLEEARRLDMGPPYGFGSMGGYHTLSEIETVLDLLSQNHPAIVSPKVSIGTSLEGRSIWAVKISDNVTIDENEPEVLFDALHHCREPMSMEATLWLMWELATGYGSDPEATFLVDEREMFFIPCVNPDGYVYNETTYPAGGGMWRKNRRDNGDGTTGIDLNRNYGYLWGFDNIGSSPITSSSTYRGPSAFSEPETQAMRDFILSRDFVVGMTSHCHGNVFMWPYSHQNGAYTPDEAIFAALGGAMSATNGWDGGPTWEVLLYEVNGGSFDWFYHDGNAIAVGCEIGPSFWPPATQMDALSASILPAYRVLIRNAGPALDLVSSTLQEVTGNANGHPDPGERMALSLELANTSIAASGPVSLTLSTASSLATIVKSTSSIGSIAPGMQANNGGDPFEFDVTAGALPGETIDLNVAIVFGSTTMDTVITVVVGTPKPVVIDSVETSFGWQLGAPGDGAVRGLWERAAPEGTMSGGQPCQAGTDHTPGGTQCFVTDGRAGSSAGSWDVDEGPTTLLTPVFDLTPLASVEISYWRWYANLSSIDDDFTVDISNNGGSNWVNVETVTGSTSNAWQEVRFRVEDHIAPTATMRMRFVATDTPNNSLVEAAIDDVRVEGYGNDSFLMAWGSHALGTTSSLQVGSEAGNVWTLLGSPQSASIVLPGIGTLGVDPAALFVVPLGPVDSEGHGAVALGIPNDPFLAGGTGYFQALIQGTGLSLTNTVTLRITP